MVPVLGAIYPPVSGDYNLWISGDDFCELWLSTDDDPANITMVASVPGWSAQYEWGKYPEQKSNVITLQAGQRYYVEALMKEAGGGDTLTVGWGGPSIGEGPVIIEGKYLEPFITSFAEVMRTAFLSPRYMGEHDLDGWIFGCLTRCVFQR
jgi:hypothetical protein